MTLRAAQAGMRSPPFSSVRMRRAGPDGKAFTAMAASPEVRAFAQLARSQSTEVDLLAGSIGACFSLCDTPAGTFECAWLAPTPRHGGCVVRGTLSGLTDRSAAACLRRICSLL